VVKRLSALDKAVKSRSLPKVVAFLEPHEHWVVRYTALQELAEPPFNRNAVEHFKAALKDDYQRVRYAAVEALYEYRTAYAFRALDNSANAGDAHTVKAVVRIKEAGLKNWLKKIGVKEGLI